MDLQGIIRQELATLADRAGRAALDIVETGTIRGADDQYRTGDGWSTIAFAEHVHDNGGTLTSIDLDVSTAAAVLADRGVRRDRVALVEGHSIRVLTRFAADGWRFDAALLDSDNDAQLILHEYLVVAAMLRRPGLLLVDDVDLDSALVVKGHALVPWLDAEGVPYEIVQRDAGGYTTGVLIARLDA